MKSEFPNRSKPFTDQRDLSNWRDGFEITPSKGQTSRMTGETPVWDPHFIEFLRGSFSAVSTATIARVGAFFHIFRDLQDLHAFAPLQTQNISYFSSKV